MRTTVLKMNSICKSFPGVQALDNVNFELYKGEVHALMGENGAGKSTLMKILNGMHKADSGSIELNEKEIAPQSSHDSLKLGISMIHQELSPIPDMTVAENIFLGHLPGKYFVNKKKLNEQTETLFKNLSLPVIAPHVRMKTLSIAQIQMVEIVKAISYKSQIIVMDEPTSAIADAEVEMLFDIIRRLTAAGISVIYISHKMDEIFRIADRISVMRDGKMIGTETSAQLDSTRLINMMVGRDICHLFKRKAENIGPVKMSVQDLCSENCFENISFDLHQGEILGITGLIGSKRTELVEAIFGLRPISAGKICIDGKEVRIKKPCDAIKNRIALVTEDRKRQGLFLDKSLIFNTSIANLINMFFGPFINKKTEKKETEAVLKKLCVKASGFAIPVSSLSGGNQQKVVLAKWLATVPEVLILDEPTRGIDVNAKQEIYMLIDELANAGKAVIVISSEMPEILALSDRILVMNSGKVRGILSGDRINKEEILAHALMF